MSILMNQQVYRTYVNILRRELISAMGCTEPTALAYCAAVARETLGALPERMTVEASGNIIKNVKSVVVPNTGGRRGIATAAAIGVLGGDAHAGLEVIARIDDETRNRIPKCRYRRYTVSEILNAVIGAGFTLERFDEHPAWENKTLPGEFTAVAVRNP